MTFFVLRRIFNYYSIHMNNPSCNAPCTSQNLAKRDAFLHFMRLAVHHFTGPIVFISVATNLSGMRAGKKPYE